MPSPNRESAAVNRIKVSDCFLRYGQGGGVIVKGRLPRRRQAATLRFPHSTRPVRNARRSGGAVVLVLLGFLLSCRLVVPESAESATPAEADVKAAFVLNFIKFVEWPASAFRSPEDPILLAIMGDDPTAAAIGRLEGKTVSGRRLVIRWVPGIAAIDPCHVLFVGASGKPELSSLLGAVQKKPVLTVADFEGFAARGGAIGFTRQSDRIGFEINDEAARDAGLKVNAKLLYLGRIVHPGPGGAK